MITVGGINAKCYNSNCKKKNMKNNKMNATQQYTHTHPYASSKLSWINASIVAEWIRERPKQQQSPLRNQANALFLSNRFYGPHWSEDIERKHIFSLCILKIFRSTECLFQRSFSSDFVRFNKPLSIHFNYKSNSNTFKCELDTFSIHFVYISYKYLQTNNNVNEFCNWKSSKKVHG